MLYEDIVLGKPSDQPIFTQCCRGEILNFLSFLKYWGNIIVEVVETSGLCPSSVIDFSVRQFLSFSSGLSKPNIGLIFGK